MSLYTSLLLVLKFMNLDFLQMYPYLSHGESLVYFSKEASVAITPVGRNQKLIDSNEDYDGCCIY